MLNIKENIYSELDFLGSAEKYVENIVGVIEHIKLFEDFALEEVKSLCRCV